MLNHLIRCFKPSAFRCQKCNLGGGNQSPAPGWATLKHPFLSTAAVHSFADIKSEDELNQLFPEAIFPVCPEGGDTLEGSMEQLKKGLESGTVLIQFEVRDPWGLGGLPDGCRVTQVITGRPDSSRDTEGLRASGRKPGRGGWGPWPIPEL